MSSPTILDLATLGSNLQDGMSVSKSDPRPTRPLTGDWKLGDNDGSIYREFEGTKQGNEGQRRGNKKREGDPGKEDGRPEGIEGRK
jgi:hypothetical protein